MSVTEAPSLPALTPAPDTPPAEALDIDALRAHADEAVAMLKVLGNADRLLLLCQMAEQERTVGELEQLTGISQPTLSQQLGVLREAGVVETRREAKQIFYRLTEARAAQLIEALYDIFCASEARS